MKLGLKKAYLAMKFNQQVSGNGELKEAR